MEIYNQNLDKYSSMGCSIYWLYHILQFKYWILVKNNFILDTLTYLEKLGLRNTKTGASFKIVYPVFAKLISSKLWINLKVVTKNVYDLRNDDTWTWGFWMPNYHKFWSLIDDWIFDKKDVDEFMKKSWVWHHLCFEGSKWGYIINSNWTKPFKCSLDTLKYMAWKWIIRETIRTIEPADKTSAEILTFTRLLRKAENLWKLEWFKELNKYNPILKKSLELYNYWK